VQSAARDQALLIATSAIDEDMFAADTTTVLLAAQSRCLPACISMRTDD